MLCYILVFCAFICWCICLSCVFVNCLVKQFAICLAAILLLNVMDVFSVGGGALFDRPCMVFQRNTKCTCYPWNTEQS